MSIRFHYHALASGVSGHLTLPVEHLIEVQAASALPSTGGHCTSRVEGFRHQHIVSFNSAHTGTTGSESATHFHTLATSTIEGLNILNVVTADRIVARMASSCAKANHEHFTTFAGSRFENLRIAGCPVEIVMDAERLKSSSRTEKAQHGAFAKATKVEGYPGVEPLPDGALYIPEFGKIYLAEYLTTACYQSITMLRVVLGCAVEGHLGVAHAAGDGDPPIH